MLLESLNLKNFRSHKSFTLKINKLTTLIIGENGSGKTSVLEAIYLCLQGKSFKGVDSEIVRWGEDFYKIELLRESLDAVVLRWVDGNKEYDIGLKKTKRLSGLDKYPVVLFEPNDLYLVNSSPTRRRDYFDRFLSQLDENYGVALRKYNKALKQRNILLKDNFNIDVLFSWNVMLARYGAELGRKRKELMEKINESFTGVYRDIAGNNDEAQLIFCGAVLSESEFLLELNRSIDKDLCVGHTTFGSHRDDYEFYFNKVSADGSASRGEIRSMILALKFIEAKIITENMRKNPVVLLDDIFSELDEIRQKRLVDNFRDNQIIITSTSVPKEMSQDISL